MSSQVQHRKAAARAVARDRVRNLGPDERAQRSAALVDLLRESDLFRAAHSMLFYSPLAGEPDVWPLVAPALALGKTVALPFYRPETGSYAACAIQNCERDLVPGRFGIREPALSCRAAPLNRLDLILVPGVAFDTDGRRLGRGKGFYDQLLMSTGGTRCGVAFEEQILETIPHETHDVSLDWIVTPRRWIRLNAPRIV